jgi:hypothetical protein
VTQVFEKLFKFTGPNLKHLLDRPAVVGPDAEPGRYCLRLHPNHVYYASKALVRRSTAVSRPRLAGVGTPTAIGRFTHHCNSPKMSQVDPIRGWADVTAAGPVGDHCSCRLLHIRTLTVAAWYCSSDAVAARFCSDELGPTEFDLL